MSIIDIVSKDICPEYNGYCYRLSNDQRLSIRPKTKIIYMSLLDMVPANPTTLQTFMTQAKKLFFEHEQRFCIYTCDQQLYCIAASILWHNTELAKYFYLRLGGMHFLMSYTRLFYKKNFYKNTSLKNPQNLKKMLRKSPASNV